METQTDSILFLFLSMVTIAASLYLPEHISFICRRAYYYLGGDGHHVSASSPSLSSIVSMSSKTVGEAVKGTAAAVLEGASGVVGEGVVEEL